MTRPAYVTCCLLVLAMLVVLWPSMVLAQTSPTLQRARALQAEAAEDSRQGRCQAAIRKAREALALREQVLGPDHLAVAESLRRLAYCLRETADYTGARPLYERALAIREKALGRNHADVAWLLSELGILLVRTADYAVSRPMLERALAIREKVFGPVHNAVAASLSELGFLLYPVGDFAAARPLLEAALTTLAAAFSQAGAQSVVASLWKANDETTGHFMVAFPRALASSGRAAALQEAQLTILRKQVTAHPFYWAPFILIGAR